MRIARIGLLLLSWLLLAEVARSEPVRVVDAERIHLADVAANVPAAWAALDVVAAPPPGGSRVVTRQDVERALRSAGVSPSGMLVEDSVRVTAASRRVDSSELALWVTSAIAAELPRGVRLKQVIATQSVVTSPSAVIGAVRLPRVPRRAGEFRTTTVVELHRQDLLLQRLTLPVVLDISQEGARPDVDRGASITLVLDTGGARLSATAVALEPGNVGDVRMFRVVKTHKVLRARVETATEARVVGQ